SPFARATRNSGTLMAITITAKEPVEQNGKLRYSYEITVTTPDELKQGERWGLNFAKGTALRNRKELNVRADAPTPHTSDVTTDEKGQPMAAVKISTKDASKGKFTINFYADSPEPKFARQTMSVDRFEDLSTEPGWRAQMFKLADTNQEPAKEQKVK